MGFDPTATRATAWCSATELQPPCAAGRVRILPAARSAALPATVGLVSLIKSPGGFRFLPTDGPFSQGVAAEPGFQIVRVRAPRHTPLDQGFRAVEQTLERAGRPLTALCAMELRIPKQLTQDGFNEFNKGYVAQHEKW